MKDLSWHPNFLWVFTPQAHTDFSLVERCRTCHAHQTTVATALTDKLLRLSSQNS
jgi:hypothetical protein